MPFNVCSIFDVTVQLSQLYKSIDSKAACKESNFDAKNLTLISLLHVRIPPAVHLVQCLPSLCFSNFYVFISAGNP